MQNILVNDGNIVVGRQVYFGKELDLDDVLGYNKVYNKKTFIYPDGFKKEVYSSKWAFHVSVPRKVKKAESVSPYNYFEHLKHFWRVPSEKKTDWEKMKESDRRACRKIEDIILLNPDLVYFCTLTFDLNKVNSSNKEEVSSVFENWLKNNVYRKGFKYVFVPEYHEKGNKIHFHGVINKVLTMADSGTRKVAGLYKPVKLTKINKWIKQGRLTEEAVGDVVYNISDWSFGFSTATVLPKDKKNIILYVTKYIEKDVMGKNKIFGKRYWSSRNVESLPPVLLENVSPDLFGSLPFKEYSSPYNPVKFKYNNNITERIE